MTTPTPPEPPAGTPEFPRRPLGATGNWAQMPAMTVARLSAALIAW